MRNGDDFPELKDLQRAIDRGDRVIALDGLTSPAAKAYVLSRLSRIGKTLVLVTDTNASLDSWESDLRFWTTSTSDKPAEIDKSAIVGLPSFDTDVYSGSSPHAETMERRALSLWQMKRDAPAFLLVSARSLIGRTVTPDELENLGATLRLDEDHSPDDLVERLAAAGYVREDPIG